jgi:hypothetical protein
MNNHTYMAEYRRNERLDSFDGDAIQNAAGWDIVNNQDEFIGFVLDGELAELELSGLTFHKFPFRGFGRLE